MADEAGAAAGTQSKKTKHKNHKGENNMKELVIYKCNTCGNLICMIDDSGVVPYCCTRPMEKIHTNMTENANLEKHVPVISSSDNTICVNVGHTDHPMDDTHYIEWICLITNRGTYWKPLLPGYRPQVCFNIYDDEEVYGAYAYCNIHGLWYKNA